MTRPAPASALPWLLFPLLMGTTALATEHAVPPVGLQGTALERAALETLDGQKYIRARAQAEAILVEDPDSFIGLWVLANVQHYEEANHPRALHLLRRARAVLEGGYGDAPRDDQAIRWHKKLLEEEGWVLSEMDHNEEQLDVLRHYDTLYRPSVKRRQIWPLMKLGRLEEAEAIARELSNSEDIWERASAYNGWLSVADERLERRATLDIGLEGIARTQSRSCILLYNTSQSALLNFRFDLAEELAHKAIRAAMQDCGNSGHVRLAPLFLLKGEFQKTVATLEEIRKQPIEKHQRQQYEMTNRALLVGLLYALGRFEEASLMAEEIYQSPDRTGMSSLSEEDFRLGHGVVHWMLLDARLERARERRSVRGLVEAAALVPDEAALRLARWRVGREVLQVAARGELLVTAMRPYMRETMPWFSGAMLRILGRGVVLGAIGHARSLDAAFAPEISGYYHAMVGEAAWLAGDPEEAIRVGHEALAQLPPQERLLRWRIEAWLADSYLHTGDATRARRHFTEVLRHYPTALRHLGVALPVRVSADATDDAGDAQEALLGSHRLRRDDLGLGFEVRVEIRELGGSTGPDSEALVICLRDHMGGEFACTEPAQADGRGGPEQSARDRLLATLDRFHDQVFAPRIALTQQDISSLDGSPIRVNADRMLKGLLGEDTGPGERP